MSPKARGGLAALLVLALGLRYAWGLHTYHDLNPDDEGLYLARGLAWAAGEARLERTWGPLYSAWYAGLSQIWPPEDAYYANLYLTTLLPPALLAGLVTRRTRSLTRGLLAGLGFLVSTANHGDWRVGHFALLGAVAAWGLWPAGRGGWPWLGQAALAWLVSYIRPEFALTALLLAGVAAWQARPRADARGKRRLWAGLLAFALLVALTHPWRDPQGRLWAAFGQHFAVRWKARIHGDFNPYGDWPQVLQRTFGPVTSLPAAARARPDLFAWFVARNLRGWVRAVLQGLTPYPWRQTWPVWGACWLLGGLLAAWRGRRRLPRAGLTALALWAAPGVLSSWLIYPRPHYQAVPLAAAWVALALVAPSLPGRISLRRGRVALAAALVLLALGMPRPYARPQPRPRYETVRALRAALPPTPARLTGWLAQPHFARLYLADRVRFTATAPPTPDLVHPWPLPAGAAPRSDLRAAAAQGRYRALRLPDGSGWLVRVP